MIYALLAVFSLIAVSCTQQDVYAPGKQDLEGCYKVYFPSQTVSAGLVTIEESASPVVKVTVIRELADDDITVPFELTGDDVFEVDDIIFEDGQTESTFMVRFPTAEMGKTYTCTIEVKDPQYVSNYRLTSNYITISVVRESWEEIGEATYIDSWFSDSKGQPISTKVKVYKSKNKKGEFRVNDPYTEFWTSVGMSIRDYPAPYFKFRILEKGERITPYNGAPEVVIPVSDMVFYESYCTGFYDSQNKGTHWYFHPGMIVNYEDPVTWYDNRILSYLDNENTMPGVVQLAPSPYIPNVGGWDPTPIVKIVFPGAKLTDYSLSVKAELPEDGKIPVNFTFSEDIAKVNYAIFEGELNESELTEKTDAMLAGKIRGTTITEAGEYIISDIGKTGIYTLIAIAYNSEGKSVNNTSTSFGYLKAGETNPVIFNCGLILSDKNTPLGYTSENSVEFYMYGEEIRSGYYGLYRKRDYDEDYEGVLANLRNNPLSETMLKEINGTGYNDIFINLNSGMEYVFVVLVSNGYEEKIVASEVKLNGEINPLQMTYDLGMLVPAQSKADFCKEWAFWSGTPTSNGRYPVGPVKVKDGGNKTETIENEDGTTSEVKIEYLEVSGFYKPVIDAGYIKDDTMKWEYYEGAIVPLHGVIGNFKDGSGQNLNLVMLSFFTGGNGFNADGAVCGAFTEEGNIAFVDMETGIYDDYGKYWYTSLEVFDSNNQHLGAMIEYDEMMFVDPANVPEDKKSSQQTFSRLQNVKTEYQKNFNCVELNRFQMYSAIDKVFGKREVKSYHQHSGLDIESEKVQIDHKIEKSSGNAGVMSFGTPGAVQPRN